MKRVVFLVLVFLVVSISMYGDIGKGDWAQDEINYFKTKKYKGNCTMYNFARKWVPPYVLPDLTESKFDGYGLTYAECVSKLILIGKLDKDTEFRYLSLLRNEIYARNGYIFKNARLKAFFNQMPWYKPVSDEVQLNAYERWNVKAIKSMEKEVRAIVSIQEPDPDTLPDKYVKKVILEAKWGSGEGEFALAGEDPVYGPGPMVIDRKGNIYISDQGNGRIAMYNSKGKLIRYFNYINFTDAAQGMAKWGKGGQMLAIRNDTLYTNIYYYDKTAIVSFNTKTGDEIKKTGYNLKNEYERLKDLLFIGSVGEYKIDENGQLRRIDIRAHFSQDIIETIKKNYAKRFGAIFIHYAGRDSLDNMYFAAFLGNERPDSSYRCVYKYSSNNKLLGYFRYLALNEMGGLTVGISPGGNVYILNEGGHFKCIDNRGPGTYKFIPGNIQLIKWELQK